MTSEILVQGLFKRDPSPSLYVLAGYNKQQFGNWNYWDEISLEGIKPVSPEIQFQIFPVQVQVNTPIFQPGELLTAISSVRSEIAEIRTSLARHQQLLEEILETVRGNTSEIDVEDVADTVARSRILELFKGSKDSLFYDEIAERLRLPLRQTVEICNQLEAEGLIGERKR
jgi:hypothetical protein